MKNCTPEKTLRIIRKCLLYAMTVEDIIYVFILFYISFKNEKLEIALYERENLLNKKTKLISKRRHQKKFMLLRHASKD